MKTLYYNIKELLQIRSEDVKFLAGKNMGDLPSISNAYLLVEGGLISDYGKMSEVPPGIDGIEKYDLSDKSLLPSWVDSHTHLVHYGSRENEFVQRIQGKTYAEIAESGGGILNSAAKLEKASERELYESSARRLVHAIRLGTGAIEIKSGYGLSLKAELKMLRVVKSLKNTFPIDIKATLLAAHAVPKKYKGQKGQYVEYIINEIIPAAAEEGLADFIDVFCEKGYFSVADMEKILTHGKTYDLRPKVHVNQFNSLGAIKSAVQQHALSVDHLEVMEDSDIDALKGSLTMPVALPCCSFFLGLPYAPGRKMIDSGLPLAISSDYNPGSCPSYNMNLVVSTSCIKMKLTPEEAINAATINSAYAMGLDHSHGSITVGKKANFIITKPISSIHYLPYSFGDSVIDDVICNGKSIKSHPSFQNII